MPPPPKFPVRISSEYVRALRVRVEALGTVAVARAAGLTPKTVWRQLAGGEGRHPTPSAIEAIRRAVGKLDPNGPPPPPPLVAVRSHQHHRWILLADDLGPDELERAILDVTKRHLRAK